MQTEALISVIIPVYNASLYLPECIRSLQAQTYHNFEAIFVDDGSTDNSASIIEHVSEHDSRFKLYRQSNAGPSAARNKALKYAKGEFIMKLDADDFVSPDFMSNGIRRISESGADAAISKVCNYFGPGDERYRNFATDFNREEVSGKIGLIKSINWDNIHSYLIIKRYIYSGIQYDTSGVFGDEVTERILIARCRKLAYTPGIYYYRFNPDSVTKKISVKQFDLCLSYIQTKQLLKDNDVYDQSKLIIETRLLNVLTSSIYYYIAHKKHLSKDEQKYARNSVHRIFDNMDTSILHNEYRAKGSLNLLFFKLKTFSFFTFKTLSALLFLKMKKYYV